MFGFLIQAKYVYDNILKEMGLKQSIEKQIDKITEKKNESKKGIMPLSNKILLGVLIANNIVILYTLIKYKI